MIARRRRILLVLLGLACLLQIVFAVLSRLDQNRIDDDAYMFVRYARNALHHGTVSWNAGDPPTYGLTSLGWLAVVLVLEAALRSDAAWVLTIATLLTGTLFVVLALTLAWVAGRGATAGARITAVFTVLLTLAWGADGLASHFVNGMDAMFTLVCLCLLSMVALGWSRHPTTRGAVIGGLLGGSLLWVRPDVLLFAFIPPAVVFLAPPRATHRRTAAVWLCTSAGVVLLLGGIAWITLGSPLPLPVYAKVLRGYGPDMQAVYAGFPAEQLRLFAQDHAVLLLLAGVGIPWILLRHGIRAVALEAGFWVAAALFLVFHRFFVLAIMGSHQRFYYPVLPVALFLAVQTVLCLWRDANSRGSTRQWGAAPTEAALLIAVLLAAASLLPGMRDAVQSLRRGPLFQHFTVGENYATNWPSDYWIRLDGFSRLPDDLVIATTEVGYPGVMNPEKRIVDLAGLNDREFARHGFSATALFARETPDLFLLPRRHYAGLRDDLLRSAEFRRGYEVFTPPRGLILALRRDSRHFGAMREVLGLPRRAAQ